MVAASYARPISAFDGAESLRVPGETSVLWWSFAGIVAAAPALAYFFPSLASVKEIALLIVGAMIYVTFARGRLIGGSVRLHRAQFGAVYEIVEECARALRMSVPAVFVRDDPLVPIVAVGMGEPFSLIISAQWVEHLTPQELRFLVGRELAHIAAGHTRVTSLLSVNGRENPIVSILFGLWLRRIEYTADRVGLLCCTSLDEALSAISVSTFHLVGRKIDLYAFAEQQREIEAERSLRIGEWISATPYATKRIAALRGFARDALFLQWSARFEEYRATPYSPPPLPAGAVARNVYANFPRRLGAFVIDAVLIEALLPNLIRSASAVITIAPDPDIPPWLLTLAKHAHALAFIDSSGGWAAPLVIVYYALLVGLAGQTFGMMVVDLRIVRQNFERVGPARALLRFAALIASMVCVVGLFSILRRVQPYEKWSGTRLVAGAALTRNRERLTAQQPAAISRLPT